MFTPAKKTITNIKFSGALWALAVQCDNDNDGIKDVLGEKIDPQNLSFVCKSYVW